MCPNFFDPKFRQAFFFVARSLFLFVHFFPEIFGGWPGASLACWLGPLCSLMNGVDSFGGCFRRDEWRASPVAQREGCSHWQSDANTQPRRELTVYFLRKEIKAAHYQLPINIHVLEFTAVLVFRTQEKGFA